MSDRNDVDPALEALPDAYADWRRSTLGRITDALEERLLLERIGLARGLRILDVGCGDAVLATRLAREGARVTGLDASAEMIAAARRRADAAGVEVGLVEGDAGDLPFAAAQFDRVVSVATLCFVDDPGRSIGEMLRVLRPGGRLILGELGRWNLWAVQRRAKGWLGSDLWRAAHFRSRGELLALAGRAGLRNATVAGAVFYPPFEIAARALAPIDPWIGGWTSAGAAFLVLTATKPVGPEAEMEPGMSDPIRQTSPILANKRYDEPSAFTPEGLLREARRQKGAAAVAVPKVCLLDPDGDIVRQLRAEGRARSHDGWVCYHTEMWVFDLHGREVGVVGCAVGASFAVLVAEEMFASGCRLLISVTSAGQITPLAAPPYYVLIDRALRDEGTSYHYLPPSQWSVAPDGLLAALDGAFTGTVQPVYRGASWTTDAPFRETPAAIDTMRALGILAVEMEAAALYAFARARGQRVVCFAHVTNQMGQVEGDFEKGQQNGAEASLEIVGRALARLAPAP